MVPQTGTIKQFVEVAPSAATYRESEERIAGIINDRPALIQSVRNIMSTERGAYPIYGLNYGVELEQYLGADFAFVESTIEETIKDALMQDDRVRDVKLTHIERFDTNSATIRFDVHDNQGSFGMEKLINV